MAFACGPSSKHLIYCWVILLLECKAIHSSEDFEVVGPEQVTAVTGEDLVLPCSLKPSMNVEDMTVEWLRVDGQGLSLAYLYQDRTDMNTNQSPSYRGRASLFKEEFKKGNASLHLKQLRVADTGRYNCLIQSTSHGDDKLIQLTVKPFQVVGPASPLYAVAGEDLVLPCSLKPIISAVGMTVKWIRLDHQEHSNFAHLYQDKRDQNDKQIQSYTGRTSLFKDELQKGNTSLKLSRVQVSDEGDYKCFVQSKTDYNDHLIKVFVEDGVFPKAWKHYITVTFVCLIFGLIICFLLRRKRKTALKKKLAKNWCAEMEQREEELVQGQAPPMLSQ